MSVRRRAWIAAAALFVAALVAVPLAGAASPAYPARAKVAKRKTAEWVADWWQWVNTIPIVVNAAFDDTGDYAAVGQGGPVWFLTGLGGFSSSSTFTVQVPAGKAVLFPLVTTFYDNDTSGVPQQLTVEQLRALAAADIDAVDPATLVCELDGVAFTDIAKRRVKSVVFDYTATPGSLPAAIDVPEGKLVYPVVADGYWVMLRPLTPGEHTLHLVGSAEITFTLDVVELQLP